MAVLPILRWPDPRLEMVCAPVTGDVAQLAADMLETMYAALGRGLAAPQVGVLLRMFVMDTAWRTGEPAPRVLLDPVVIWRSDALVSGPEGCLSLPGQVVDVARAAEVRMRWRTLEGHVEEALFAGFDAVCAQHEADHLEGILTLDHLDAAARTAAEAAVQR